jgi:hypothetical protein
VKHRDPKIAAAFEVLYDLETEKLLEALFADCGAPYHKAAHARSAGIAAAGHAADLLALRHVTLTLAKRHVPGFQVANRKTGRRQSPDHYEILRDMIKQIHRNKGLSIRAAAKAVARARRLPGTDAVAIDQLYRRHMKKVKS